MGRCCYYAVGTLALLLLVTSVTLLVARVFQKAVDQTIQKVRVWWGWVVVGGGGGLWGLCVCSLVGGTSR